MTRVNNVKRIKANEMYSCYKITTLAIILTINEFFYDSGLKVYSLILTQK